MKFFYPPMNSYIPQLLALASVLSTTCAAADLESTAATTTGVKDNQEVGKLVSEDQSDRESKDGKPIDWRLVGPRDQARRKRVLELYAAGELKTGKDYFYAGLLLQHGERPEDYLLCHELCVAAVFKSGGAEKASWLSSAKQLAAASEDRFLLKIGRPQRFGTQFSRGEPNSPWHLDQMEEGVTDELRKAWDIPSLAKAKERESEINKQKR